jgi:DNA-binding MarR family transcriptional regulator
MQDATELEAVRNTVVLATRALVGIAARSLAEVSDEVSLAQYRVLVLLDGRGPQTMGQLAASLDVNPSTVTRVCDVLVEKRLIRRFAAKDNRRNVSAELTVRGRKLLAGVMAHRRRIIDGALTRMAPQSQRRLARALAEFAQAAGEVSDAAWELGWSLDEGGTLASPGP